VKENNRNGDSVVSDTRKCVYRNLKLTSAEILLCARLAQDTQGKTIMRLPVVNFP